MTKQDRVINYLTKGKTLSQDSAASMFEVGNLRATISDIKPIVSKRGFTVHRTTGRHGETRYGLTAKATRRRKTTAQHKRSQVKLRPKASVTQLVECHICNMNVAGANPATGSFTGWCKSSTEAFGSSSLGANPSPVVL